MRKFIDKILFILFILAHAILLPRIISWEFPRVYGYVEGVTGYDMTGIGFSKFGGVGDCRILNVNAALDKSAPVVFGVVYDKTHPKKSYPHLWSKGAGGEIIDFSCPVSKERCRERKEFAVVDSGTGNILWSGPSNENEMKWIFWGQQYLQGYKKTYPHI